MRPHKVKSQNKYRSNSIFSQYRASRGFSATSSIPKPTAGECVHLVTRGYFRSREWRLHIIRSAIAENSIALYFSKTGVMADRSFTLHD